jgi:hypothetical protein
LSCKDDEQTLSDGRSCKDDEQCITGENLRCHDKLDRSLGNGFPAGLETISSHFLNGSCRNELRRALFSILYSVLILKLKGQIGHACYL